MCRHKYSTFIHSPSHPSFNHSQAHHIVYKRAYTLPPLLREIYRYNRQTLTMESQLVGHRGKISGAMFHLSLSLSLPLSCRTILFRQTCARRCCHSCHIHHCCYLVNPKKKGGRKNKKWNAATAATAEITPGMKLYLLTSLFHSLTLIYSPLRHTLLAIHCMIAFVMLDCGILLMDELMWLLMS